MAIDDSRDTKQRILDAAERLFAARGFDGTSMRGITTEAGVNLAAVNYHFGSKESLIGAVFDRRIGPINAERLRLLDGLDAPSVEQIVEAFVRPPFCMWRDEAFGTLAARLLGRVLDQPNDAVRHLFIGQFLEVFRRFSEALAQALPGVPSQEIVWRMLFMVGAMAHTLALSDELDHVTGGHFDTGDVEATIRRIVPFLAAGMRQTAEEGRP